MNATWFKVPEPEHPVDIDSVTVTHMDGSPVVFEPGPTDRLWFCGKYPAGEHVVTLSNGQTAVVAFEEVAK